MDCRTRWQLGLGVMIGVLGCKSQQVAQNPMLATPSGQVVATAPVVKEKELPKRDPQPSLLVAYGDFQFREAADASRTPLEKEQIYDRARRAYQKALEQDPNNLPALQSLSHLYVALQDHDRAIATYQRTLKAYPKNASVWFDLGVYQSRCKEWDPAVQNLRQALTLDPENRFYANWLGNCLARAGRYDESLACFQTFVGPAQAHYNVARMQVHLQQEQAARQHLRLALQADPKHEEAQLLLKKLELGGVQQASFQSTSGASGIKIGLED
jgi:tetratricopeptide (TPR) repeat protein